MRMTVLQQNLTKQEETHSGPKSAVPRPTKVTSFPWGDSWGCLQWQERIKRLRLNFKQCLTFSFTEGISVVYFLHCGCVKWWLRGKGHTLKDNNNLYVRICCSIHWEALAGVLVRETGLTGAEGRSGCTDNHTAGVSPWGDTEKRKQAKGKKLTPED